MAPSIEVVLKWVSVFWL